MRRRLDVFGTSWGTRIAWAGLAKVLDHSNFHCHRGRGPLIMPKILCRWIRNLPPEGLVDGSSYDGIDMVIKYLDLEPNIDIMMRDFLELEVCGIAIISAPTRTVSNQRGAALFPSGILMEMEDRDMTLEEYVQYETEKALRNGKVYNLETTTYGKIKYVEDIDDLRFFETEFPAIVYEDALSLESGFSYEPTALHGLVINWSGFCGMLHGLVINWSSSAIETSRNRVNGPVPLKIARKSKKASPSKKDSDLVPIDEEPVKKGKRVKRPAKKFTTNQQQVSSSEKILFDRRSSGERSKKKELKGISQDTS
ncbi:hypothetical protein Tco_1326305 [Tanacetum coccineum]